MINLINKQISSRLKLLVLWNVPRNFTGMIEFLNGTKCWYLNGQYHRTNGPALEYVNGSKFWALNGLYYSEKEFKKEIQKLNDKFSK